MLNYSSCILNFLGIYRIANYLLTVKYCILVKLQTKCCKIYLQDFIGNFIAR